MFWNFSFFIKNVHQSWFFPRRHWFINCARTTIYCTCACRLVVLNAHENTNFEFARHSKRNCLALIRRVNQSWWEIYWNFTIMEWFYCVWFCKRAKILLIYRVVTRKLYLFYFKKKIIVSFVTTRSNWMVRTKKKVKKVRIAIQNCARNFTKILWWRRGFVISLCLVTFRNRK